MEKNKFNIPVIGLGNNITSNIIFHTIYFKFNYVGENRNVLKDNLPTVVVYEESYYRARIINLNHYGIIITRNIWR